MSNSNISKADPIDGLKDLKEQFELINTKLPQILYFWETYDRVPYKEPLYVKTLVALVTLIMGLYFWWVGQILMTFAVVAVFYLYYMIVTVQPVKVEHKIFTNGIWSIDRFYPWDSLVDFWVTWKDGWYVVYVNTRLRMPRQLILLVDNEKQLQKIVLLLGLFLPYKIISKQGFFSEYSYGKYISVDNILFNADVLLDQKQLKKIILDIAKESQKRYVKLKDKEKHTVRNI